MGASACVPGAGTISIATTSVFTKGAPVASCDADVTLLTPDQRALATDAAVVNRMYKISATLCEVAAGAIAILADVWDEDDVGVATPDDIGDPADTIPGTYAIVAAIPVAGGVTVTLTSAVSGASELTSEPGAFNLLTCEFTAISGSGGALGSIA